MCFRAHASSRRAMKAFLRRFRMVFVLIIFLVQSCFCFFTCTVFLRNKSFQSLMLSLACLVACPIHGSFIFMTDTSKRVAWHELRFSPKDISHTNLSPGPFTHESFPKTFHTRMSLHESHFTKVSKTF